LSPSLDHLAAALADRYTIERRLGEGGMATVYLAEDLKHDRKVAVKVLKPELAAVLGAERFVQEIKTTASLQHPNILPLFDSGEAEGFLYYVMPYIEGETLREKLDRETQLSIDEAVKITTEVADALDSAHQQGVVHRDIKPENILLHNGRPMVADFGIALAVSAAAGGRMTETGLSLGTPHYMSPEQATAEKDLTSRADIYSLGSVLYEMLTGSPPHVGASAQQIIMKIVTEEVRPVTQVRKSVPPQVARTVAKALEKLPADRFSSAHELAEALKGRVILAAGQDQGGGLATAPAAIGWQARVRDPFWIVPMAVAAAAVVASWVSRPDALDPRPLLAELEPPRGTEYGEQQFAALSPDGGRLAFIALGSSGGRQIWIRDLETGRVDSFPTTRGAEAPFWSPTGRSLGFFQRGALWRLELDGTIPRQLCDAADVGGSWSTENLILFTYRGEPMTVPGDGGACEAVAGGWADSGIAVSRPAWYPDGRHFAAVTSIHGGGRILGGSLAGDSPRTVLEGASAVRLVEPDVLVFGRNGLLGSDVIAQRYDPKTLDPIGRLTTLAQGVRRDAGIPSFAIGATALVYLPMPTSRGADQGPLLVDTDGAMVDSVVVQGAWTWRYSRDGQTVALGGDGLWLYDLDRGTPFAVRTSESIKYFPVWSPGDSMLVVTELVEGDECGLMLGPLRLIRLGSGIDVALTETTTGVDCAVASDWTADGELLVLTGFEGRSNRGSVWTYALATGEMDRLVSVEGTASAAVVSPDMQWLAYVSDQTGELQVYVRPFRRDGPAVPVSTGGGALPRWRGDGRALFYQAPDGSVRRVTVGAGSSLALGDPEVLFQAPRWSLRLFADQLYGMQITTPYDVSPDGQRFLVRQGTQETSAAVLVMNWQALLEEGANNQ
jgi:serine/threonine-protein kinase